MLPKGYGYEFSGLSREELKAGNTSTFIFILSILFVFLFLSALYESWTVPFTILLGVPLAAFGAILALTLIPSLSNNVYAQIGLITLIGLAAKNSILIVEFAKERVDRGIEIVAATIEAVRLRLRPISDDFICFHFRSISIGISNRCRCRCTSDNWMVGTGRYACCHCIRCIYNTVLFILIIRLTYGKKKLAELQANFKPFHT